MATIKGKEGKVTVGGDDDRVGEVTNWEIEEQCGTVETTSLDNADDWKTHKATLKEWSGSLDCHFDPTDTDGQNAMEVGETVELKVYPSGDATGKKFYTGSAIVKSRNAGMGGLEDLNKISISFTGTGPLELDTVSA